MMAYLRKIFFRPDGQSQPLDDAIENMRGALAESKDGEKRARNFGEAIRRDADQTLRLVNQALAARRPYL